MATYTDLGRVSAIVEGPLGQYPDDTSCLFHEWQNNEKTDFLLKRYNPLTQVWENLSNFQPLIERVEIEVQNDGEIMFTLPRVCSAPERSIVSVSGLGFLTYGTNYTISGNTLTFIPNNTHGLVLSENDIISVLYYY